MKVILIAIKTQACRRLVLLTMASPTGFFLVKATGKTKPVLQLKSPIIFVYECKIQRQIYKKFYIVIFFFLKLNKKSLIFIYFVFHFFSKITKVKSGDQQAVRCLSYIYTYIQISYIRHEDFLLLLLLLRPAPSRSYYPP